MAHRSTSEPHHTWETPPTLIIPCPMEMTRKQGAFAKKEDDFPMSMRITQHDRELLLTEARMIGVSPSAFMRWCSMHVARELHRIRTGKTARIDL